MRPLLTAALCAVGCPAALAAPITVMHQHTVYEVAADGTSTTEVDTATRIDDPQVVSSVGQTQVQYSDSLQTLEILEAYTVTKDGQRIDVPADKIITQQLPASSGAPTFSDNKVKNVVFPQVEVGATLNLRYRLRQVKPYLPGVFSAFTAFNPFVDIQAGDIVLRAPEKLKLYVSSRTVQGGEVKSSVPGRREWRWTYGDAKAISPEPGSVMVETISPYVEISTLEAYPRLAEAYMIGAAPAAKVTPAVQKLAEEITAGITDRRAQAEALYRWVSLQIRYVALAMGTGGYVPHQADDIIAARYGDCKDKTTLLAALLHARGIRAMPVLANTGAAFSLPDTAILGAFNHAITYLPDWDLYVDSTPGMAPFGVLSSSLMGKPVLLAGDEAMKPALRTIPASSATRDRLVLRTAGTIAADGSITGTNSIEALGTGDLAIRSSFGSIPEALRPTLAKSLLPGSGEATLKLGDARDLTKPFSFVFEFKALQRVNIPGPGALTGPYGMSLSLGARSFATSALQVERKLDFPCPDGVGVEEIFDLTLPAEMKITNLPRAADLASPYGHFADSYEVKDGHLLMDRRLELTPPHAVCTAADGVELRKFATAINQQLRAQILYQ